MLARSIVGAAVLVMTGAGCNSNSGSHPAMFPLRVLAGEREVAYVTNTLLGRQVTVQVFEFHKPCAQMLAAVEGDPAIDLGLRQIDSNFNGATRRSYGTHLFPQLAGKKITIAQGRSTTADMPIDPSFVDWSTIILERSD